MTTIHDISSALDGFVQAACSWDSNGYRKRASDQLANAATRSRADLCTLDGLLEECARGMAQLRRVRATVAAELNSYAPVNLLPDEILALIFEHHDATADYFGHHYLCPHPSFTVSSVCTRWRAVALAFPVLWSRLDVNASRTHLSYLSERAEGYPLSLFYDHCMSGSETPGASLSEHKIAEFLETNLARVQYLELNTLLSQNHDLHKEVVDVLLRTQAPSLKELTMSSHYQFALTQPLFGGHAPQIRQLTVSGVHMTWSSGLYSSLTSLSIKSGSIIFLPDTDLCDILHSLPCLESLCLQRPEISNMESQGCTPRRQLTSLRTLALDLPASDISHILSSFELPALHSMSLTPRVAPDSLAPLDHGINMIPPLCSPGMLPRPLLASVARLHLTFTRKIGYVYESQHILLNGHSSNGVLVFSLSCYFASSVADMDVSMCAFEVACDLGEHYLAASVSTLILESSFDRRYHPLIHFLSYLPSSANIVLKGLDAQTSILSFTFITGLSRAAHRLSALHELTLQRLKLDEAGVKALSECCQKLDGGLQTLIFEDVELIAPDEAAKNALDSLRGVVAQVDVRGLNVVPPSK